MFYYKCKVIKSNTENGLLFIIKGLLSIIIDLLTIFTGLYAIILHTRTFPKYQPIQNSSIK